MKNTFLQLSLKVIAWFVIAFLFSAVCILSCTSSIKQTQTKSTQDSCECYSSSVLFNVQIYFNNNVPGDLLAFNNQSQANCFAWQEFIALNWSTDSTHGFGDPGDLTAVQWETYMPKDVLFQPNGVPPPNWGTLVSEKYAAKFKSQRLLMNPMKTKLLTFTSKFEGADTLHDMDFGQAAPFGAPNWLGAQNNTNVWYEIMLNKDYYDFVVKKGYYNAAVQHDSVQAGDPLNFPQGQYNGPVGAIELKAAWMETDGNSDKWKRYKQSQATVLDATTGKLRNTVVALVGLHILHKTRNQPTWVWATFEQSDNVPNNSGTVPPYGYNFYNSKCTAQTFPVKNAAGTGDTTVTVTCTPNTSPPYYLSQGTPVPIQITRVNPIDPTDAVPVNKRMQQSIKHFYPNSVYQYYELVDVIWSQSLQPDPTQPIPAPRSINKSSMASGASIVANSTLESYVQKTNTCTSCHVYSTIAPYPLDTAHNNIFGDFSFAISAATAKIDPATYDPRLNAGRKRKKK